MFIKGSTIPLNHQACLVVLKYLLINGRVQCFSIHDVKKKRFLLNPEKKLAQMRLVIFEKTQKPYILIPKNVVT